MPYLVANFKSLDWISERPQLEICGIDELLVLNVL